MREVTPENAVEYLRETGRIGPNQPATAKALGWGVSNVVIRVDIAGEPSIVLKQAREKLRTRALWLSRIDRIWTEREALELLASVLPEGTVPRVIFSDEPNYLFAMTCAPDDSVVWKEQLLAGESNPAVAKRAGELLAIIHSKTRDHPALKGRLADTTVFDELRIDPFYREIARVHPEIAPQIEALIASMARVEHPCLVLADFSPKNILVHSQGLTLVDFETAHAGDPAYDLGFFLSHLWLKDLSLIKPPVLKGRYSLMDEFLAAYSACGGFTASALLERMTPSASDRTDECFAGVSGPVLWHLAACSSAGRRKKPGRVSGRDEPGNHPEDPSLSVLARQGALATI